MSETASFVDPVFLARFGLARPNVLDYFLHPLNPFRTQSNTSNEVLSMQGITVPMLMQHGISNEPMTLEQAEDEYNKALARLTGEQYELLQGYSSTPLNNDEQQHQCAITAPLYTIRHVLRTSINTVKVLGIYYVGEGIIYKSPSVRSLQKTHVARCLDGLKSACSALADECVRYSPSTGYVWVFDDSIDELGLSKLVRKRRRKVLGRRPGEERTAAEEEGIRATEAMDQILVRLSKSLQQQQPPLPKPTMTVSSSARITATTNPTNKVKVN
jgi:hypothetical protein